MEKDTFIIWMAGFYEGEGYVSNDISNNNRLRLGIDQNDATPLHKAKEIWGGNINSRTRVTPTGKICKGNTWRLSHHESLKFIEDIRPFLQIPYKINQIEKAIENSKIRLNLWEVVLLSLHYFITQATLLK